MRGIPVALVLAFALSVTNPAISQTVQQADIVIVNKTSRTLAKVAVVHKYSNVFQNKFEWDNVESGTTSTKKMSVKYRTGLGTTGQDWWMVGWAFDGDEAYVTDPQNFRDVIDIVEGVVIKAAPSLVTLPANYAWGGPVISIIAGMALNSEATAGFKSHILRVVDAKKQTQIIIMDDKITFHSVSGDDDTIFKQVPVDGDIFKAVKAKIDATKKDASKQ